MAPVTAFLVASLASLAAANTCNGDNCLNAMRQHSAAASSFCNTYTTTLYGTAAPTPTYVPTTCGPQRLSSACYCVDGVSNPTYTPAACPTGQVGQNPSFYGQPAADSRNVDIRPWVLAVPTGVPGCVPAVGYSLADMSTSWGDPRSMYVVLLESWAGRNADHRDQPMLLRSGGRGAVDPHAGPHALPVGAVHSPVSKPLLCTLNLQ